MVIAGDKEEKGKSLNKKKENSLPAQIEELKLTHAKEMSALLADLNKIKTALLADSKPCAHWGDFDKKKHDEMGNRQRGHETFQRNKKRCPECEMKNYWRCFHCFICCSVDHRMNVCPERNKQKNY